MNGRTDDWSVDFALLKSLLANDGIAEDERASFRGMYDGLNEIGSLWTLTDKQRKRATETAKRLGIVYVARRTEVVL